VTCNIVPPVESLAPILQVLGATLHVVTAKGTDVIASDLPIKDFWVRPEEDISRENILVAGQVIREVFVPDSLGRNRIRVRRNAREGVVRLGSHLLRGVAHARRRQDRLRLGGPVVGRADYLAAEAVENGSSARRPPTPSSAKREASPPKGRRR
jgi:CO/xanthine dehydrogenase FAD-binding subunit